MAKKKVNRKKLLKEPDEFMTFSNRLLQWTMRYRFQLLAVLGGSICLALVITAIHYFSNKAESRASAMLQAAQERYESIRDAKSPEEAYRRVAADFESIIDNYQGRQAARNARLVFANYSYQAGQYETAVALYRQGLDAFPEEDGLHPFIFAGLGYSLAGKKDHPAAAEFFERAAAATDTFIQAEALFNLGRVYGQLGERDKGIAAYQRLVDEHADSIYAPIAREKTSGYSE